MTATGHAVIGTVLASQITNPYIGIPVAILSHLAADSFPHWDTGTNYKKKPFHIFWIQSLIDLGASFVLPFFLISYLSPQPNLFYLYTMVISAQLLDWLAVPYVFLKLRFPPFSWLNNIQKPFDNRLDQPWGVILQVTILLVMIGYAKVF
ncbi:hypothetical protein BH11PAT1_BH11PAT1_3870 [soil metagenome]